MIVSDITRAWATPVTLAADEVWMCTSGRVAITTTSEPDDNDGLILGRGGRALPLASGLEVSYRQVGATPARLVREVV